VYQLLEASPQEMQFIAIEQQEKLRHQSPDVDKLAKPFKPRTALQRKCIEHCETSTLTPTWRRYHKRYNILRNSPFKASSCSPFDRFLFKSKTICDTINHN